MGTLAEERGDSVVARGALRTGGAGTVVDVLAAVVARPAVHTHAVEAADGVMTRSAVLTSVGGKFTLVDVLRTVLTCEWKVKGYKVGYLCEISWCVSSPRSLTGPMFVAVTVVGVDPVNAPASILTGVLGAVINIMFTGLTHKSCERQIIRVHIKACQTVLMSSSDSGHLL